MGTALVNHGGFSAESRLQHQSPFNSVIPRATTHRLVLVKDRKTLLLLNCLSLYCDGWEPWDLNRRREFCTCPQLNRGRSRNWFSRPVAQHTGGSNDKKSAWSAGGLGSIPGSGKSTGKGNGYPLQYSCLEISMNGGAWRAIVHGVVKSQTWLRD